MILVITIINKFCIHYTLNSSAKLSISIHYDALNEIKWTFIISLKKMKYFQNLKLFEKTV